jgi:membrane protein YdbS with pleckstrin-like domain
MSDSRGDTFMIGINEMEQSTRHAVILNDRPETRRALILLTGLALMSFICALVFAACLMQTDPGRSSWTWVSGIATCSSLVVVINYAAEFARLRSERYVVTLEAIEITSGILRRDSRKIPFSRILDVTANASFDRRLFGLGNITVSIANGDTITLEDIADWQTKAETLWNLIHKS